MLLYNQNVYTLSKKNWILSFCYHTLRCAHYKSSSDYAISFWVKILYLIAKTGMNNSIFNYICNGMFSNGNLKKFGSMNRKSLMYFYIIFIGYKWNSIIFVFIAGKISFKKNRLPWLSNQNWQNIITDISDTHTLAWY